MFTLLAERANDGRHFRYPRGHRLNPAGMILKRATDVLLATILLIISLPLLVLVVLAIYSFDGLPIIFHQIRAGRYGHSFTIYKFRSMRRDIPATEQLTQVELGNPMVTRVGRWLRRAKLDEWPQLLNVLRGEMSLVGPRSPLVESVARYSDFQHRRLDLRPGMTGWAQVNGNVQLSWDDRILLDVWYVDHWSYWLDWRILVMTFAVVLKGERTNHRMLEVAREHALRTGWCC